MYVLNNFVLWFFTFIHLYLHDTQCFICMPFIWNALFYFVPVLLCIAQFESCSGSSSSAKSTSSQRAVSPGSNSNRPLTAHEQLFGVSHDPVPVHYGITSPGSSDVSPQLSPVFKSEAARAIVMEMAFMRDAGGHNMEHQPHRRAVPKEKRRHHTVSSSQPLLDIESSVSPNMVYTYYKACHFPLLALFTIL